MIPILSIILTLTLPAVVIWRANRKKPLRRPYLFSIGSFMFCAVAMIRELGTVKRRLFSGDIGGIEDTIGATLVMCIILLVCAGFLNFVALGLSYESTE